MQTFGELLNEYISRVGISDSELARVVGVSRQTVFRWKEGQTSRPRRRADVLAIADKLRLTAEEQDSLLLAAGFRPVNNTPPQIETIVAEQPPPTPQIVSTPVIEQAQVEDATQLPTPPLSSTSYKGWLIGGVISLLALLLIGAGWWWPYNTSTPNEVAIPKITSSPITIPMLVLIGDIKPDFTSALQREIKSSRLREPEVLIWPDPVEDMDAAQQIVQTLETGLVLYGQGDRLQIFSSQPFIAIDGLELTLNNDSEDRFMALITLGLFYINQVEFAQAHSFLSQLQPTLVDTLAEPTHTQVQLLVNLTRLTQGSAMSIIAPELETLLQNQPDNPAILHTLCRGYALAGQAEQALPYCQQAIALQANPIYFDSRAIAYAIKGDFEASINDFEQYHDWLRQQSGEQWLHQQKIRTSWIAHLKESQSPFSPEALGVLQARFGW